LQPLLSLLLLLSLPALLFIIPSGSVVVVVVVVAVAVAAALAVVVAVVVACPLVCHPAGIRCCFVFVVAVVFAVAARYSEASASRLRPPPQSGLHSAEDREPQRAFLLDGV
jgi:hypothetical protein